MFIGHYAVAFASKRFAPRTSLGALIAAASLLDLLWPIFILLGWEQVRIQPGNTDFLRSISFPTQSRTAWPRRLDGPRSSRFFISWLRVTARARFLFGWAW